MSACFEKAYASPDLSLNAKRSVKNVEQGFADDEKDLQKYLGPGWRYSVDFVEFYNLLAKYENKDPFQKGVSAEWAQRLGELVQSYVVYFTYGMGTPFEYIARESLSKDAFNAKVTRKVVCVKLTSEEVSEAEMMGNTDPKRGLYCNFDYVDGAFVVSIRLQRVAINTPLVLSGDSILASL